MAHRTGTRRVDVGGVAVGGGAPVAVQSMTNTDTRDPEATLAQIGRLERAGCEIVRVAVPDEAAAGALARITPCSPLPLVADIHFDHRLALLAIDAGVHGLRLNPGNIGAPANVGRVARAAGAAGIPIRIGVNAGSLEKGLLARHGGPTPEAMVESALSQARLLEEAGFTAIKVSLKSSSVLDTVAAYRLMAARADYPLHLGVTEAGTLVRGAVKSSVGLGILLAEGIGDTIRVSLTADPVEEMRVAWEILRAVGLRRRGVEIVSCPTCGRCEIDLLSLADEVERRLAHVTQPLTVAVMGCVVNGPGEARAADLGVAGGRGQGIVFRQGRLAAKVGEARLVDRLVEEVDRFLAAGPRKNEKDSV